MICRLCRFFSARVVIVNYCGWRLTKIFLPGILLKFILYSRSNCPLCEAMEEELIAFVEEYGITVIRQYIDNEVTLQNLYGDKVPVLTLNNKILCHYFLDTAILRKAISDNT